MNGTDLRQPMNTFKATSTWMIILAGIAQIAKVFGFALNVDPEVAQLLADSVSTICVLWATWERMTGEKRLVKPSSALLKTPVVDTAAPKARTVRR